MIEKSETRRNRNRRSQLLRYRHVRNSFIAVNLIVLLGTLGFMIFEELSFFDALWLTVITVLTVGYGDSVPQSGEGKIFALIIIPAAIGIVSYGVGAIASVMLEGEFSKAFKEKKMKKDISKLKDHLIVCGIGRVGEQVLDHLAQKGLDTVYIDQDAERMKDLMEDGEYYLIGDATENEVLKSAGIMNAKGLVTTLPSDADNVFVTLTAKGLNPDLHVVARAERLDSVEKLERAGASKVINPSSLGGKQMAMSILKPLSVEYVDIMLKTSKHDYGFEELSLDDGSSIAGRKLGEADIRNQYGVTIVAILRNDDLISNPDADEELRAGDKIIVFGDTEVLTKFEEITKGQGGTR